MRWSSNTLAMIIVLEMDTSAAANRLSIRLHPRAWPTTYPSDRQRPISTAAMSPAVEASRPIFRSVKPRPSENIRRMTPSSESVRTVPTSATRGRKSFGPMMNPATR
jgi:hypothetical protein